MFKEGVGGAFLKKAIAAFIPYEEKKSREFLTRILQF